MFREGGGTHMAIVKRRPKGGGTPPKILTGGKGTKKK
jgi:hypothetical protein